MKFTAKADRVFVDDSVVGVPVPRCILWDGGNGVHTSIVKMSKGMDLGPHKHETWVQVFVLKGKLYQSRGKKVCVPGDYYFVEPNESHVEIALEETEVMIIKPDPYVQYPIGKQGNSRLPVDLESLEADAAASASLASPDTPQAKPTPSAKNADLAANPTASVPAPLAVRVKSMTLEAANVMSIELHPVDGVALPPFTAGAHVDVQLANGITRSYSLLNDPAETHRYVLGVALDRASRGGSRYVHTQLRTGAKIRISAPRNHFPLEESAGHTVLIAGGIGITPLLAMARRLRSLGRSVEMLYCSRSRDEAAFLSDLQQLGIELTLHHDDVAGGPPDLTSYISARPEDAHYYACGPAPMLDAFEQICARLGRKEARVERFSAAPIVKSADAKDVYEVELRRSKQSLRITPEKSLLAHLLDAGVPCGYSCEEGLCGACETVVLDGVPDHRDQVLSAEQRSANRSMIVCVSGSCSERLVLDL